MQTFIDKYNFYEIIDSDEINISLSKFFFDNPYILNTKLFGNTKIMEEIQPKSDTVSSSTSTSSSKSLASILSTSTLDLAHLSRISADSSRISSNLSSSLSVSTDGTSVPTDSTDSGESVDLSADYITIGDIKHFDFVITKLTSR